MQWLLADPSKRIRTDCVFTINPCCTSAPTERVQTTFFELLQAKVFLVLSCSVSDLNFLCQLHLCPIVPGPLPSQLNAFARTLPLYEALASACSFPALPAVLYSSPSASLTPLRTTTGFCLNSLLWTELLARWWVVMLLVISSWSWTGGE